MNQPVFFETNDIEPTGKVGSVICRGKETDGRPADLLLFLDPHCCRGDSAFVGASIFYFYKNDGTFIPGNQVNFSKTAPVIPAEN